VVVYVPLFKKTLPLPDQMRIHLAHSRLKNTSADITTKQCQQNKNNKPLQWKARETVSEKEYLIHLMAYSVENIQEAFEVPGILR